MIPTVSSTLRGNLLIIDDQDDHQVIIGHVLRLSLPNATITFAATAEQALAYLHSTNETGVGFPCLVMLDIRLPDAQTGWQLLEHLRTQYRRLPVIVLSAHDERDDVLKAYQLGANSFISKPVRSDQWNTFADAIRSYWLQTVTLSTH